MEKEQFSKMLWDPMDSHRRKRKQKENRKKKNFNLSHILHKNNSKCITELNIRARVVKPQEENTGDSLYDLELDRFLKYDTKSMIHKR